MSDSWGDFLRTIAGSLIGVLVGGALTFVVQHQLDEYQEDRASDRVAYERRVDAYVEVLRAARDLDQALSEALNASAPTATSASAAAAEEHLRAALDAMATAEITVSLIGPEQAANEVRDVLNAAAPAFQPLPDDEIGDTEAIQELIVRVQQRTAREAREMSEALTDALDALLH